VDDRTTNCVSNAYSAPIFRLRLSILSIASKAVIPNCSRGTRIVVRGGRAKNANAMRYVIDPDNRNVLRNSHSCLFEGAYGRPGNEVASAKKHGRNVRDRQYLANARGSRVKTVVAVSDGEWCHLLLVQTLNESMAYIHRGAVSLRTRMTAALR